MTSPSDSLIRRPDDDETAQAKPIHLARPATLTALLKALPRTQRRYARACGFSAARGTRILLPEAQDDDQTPRPGGVLLGLGDPAPRDDRFLVGTLARWLPGGAWKFAQPLPEDPFNAALAWMLSSRRYSRRRETPRTAARLIPPDGLNVERAVSIADATGYIRDLIDAPADQMTPQALAESAKRLAENHHAEGASCRVIDDPEILAREFPLLHAVGRAADASPRLIDLRFERTGSDGRPPPKVTIAGKGVCYDTGGLSLKSVAHMRLMKKDMGGAANALGVARMIMEAKLPIQLRVIIPAAENAVSGNSYRPGDILESRSGLTVEIGDCDAEGRLLLADALALADEERPDLLVSMATLTGAARIAAGPELAPFYSSDDKLAEALSRSGAQCCDPLWRMPLHEPYDDWIVGEFADLANISPKPLAGSIIAALFLRRFVSKARRFVHFDIFGWSPSSRPGYPAGGADQGARALFDLLSRPDALENLR